MLPNSQFSRPSSSFEVPVPAPGTSPGAERLLCVSFNERWLPYIIGSLKQLTLNTTFDVPEGSPEFMLVQMRASELINRFVNAAPCKIEPPQGWGGGDEELMIRQDPDNPCLLQSSIDGINWCTFADLSKCTTPSAQPGGGTPQPAPGGGQQCYNARMMGSNTWLLPTALNTGDVVEVQNASGAVSSSHNGNWYCPSGSQFFAGTCVGFEYTNGADPVPTAPGESLVINIAGTYYSLNSGAFTVPSGVSNSQAFIQVNDATLVGKSGELTFDVCVTNNQAETWNVAQNLAVSSGGWSPVTDGFDGGETAWVAGAGWEQVSCHSNTLNTGRYDIVYLDLVFDSTTTLTHADITYDATVGDLSDGGGDALQAFYSGAWHTLAGQASANGTNRTLIWNGVQAGVSKMRVLLYGADLTGTSCPTPGTALLKLFNMAGVGVAPF